HLAGRLGVALADALAAGGYVELERDAGLVAGAGLALFSRIGIDVSALSGRGKRTRVLCRGCLGWGERGARLGGAVGAGPCAGGVGAALCTCSFEEGWIRRVKGTRAVAITPAGQRVFRETIGARLDDQP